MSEESIEMTVKDSHSVSSSGKSKPWKLVWTLSPNVHI